MLSRLLRARVLPGSCAGILSRAGFAGRKLHNTPFHDDLTPATDDFLNLEDFQHYKEAPDVLARRQEMGLDDSALETMEPVSQSTKLPDAKHRAPKISNRVQPAEGEIPQSETRQNPLSFEELCATKAPVVFISKLSDPYLNLAIEDYVYNQMPLPKQAENGNFNRLMFYVNSPCVVIGKNQNPWKEVNLPLLANLKIPLVRRRSGGGTVVHDFGNVNYSFMTSKESFDRFTFANLVVRAVNSMDSAHKKIAVNGRGDIVTEADNDKVSGSAYKLSKGKSYHHGTMLLQLKLDVLRKLLHRDESLLGEVHSSSAVASVKSPVTNLFIEKDDFIDAVAKEFQDQYGVAGAGEKELEQEESEYDQTDLLGLQGFVDAFSLRQCEIVYIDESTELPGAIQEVRGELTKWDWKFGSTPKFLHHFHHREKDVRVKIDVEKKGVIAAVSVEAPSEEGQDAFQFLKAVIERGDSIQYTGSNVAGFVVDDELSEWIGNAIDGSS